MDCILLCRTGCLGDECVSTSRPTPVPRSSITVYSTSGNCLRNPSKKQAANVRSNTTPMKTSGIKNFMSKIKHVFWFCSSFSSQRSKSAISTSTVPKADLKSSFLDLELKVRGHPSGHILLPHVPLAPASLRGRGRRLPNGQTLPLFATRHLEKSGTLTDPH